jgi:hypothetical protein
MVFSLDISLIFSLSYIDRQLSLFIVSLLLSTSWWQERGNEFRRSPIQALAVVVSSAVDGATSRRRAAISPSVATAQATLGQVTTNAMQLGVRRSRHHSAATRLSNALTGREIILCSAAGALKRAKQAKRSGRAEKREQPDKRP